MFTNQLFTVIEHHCVWIFLPVGVDCQGKGIPIIEKKKIYKRIHLWIFKRRTRKRRRDWRGCKMWSNYITKFVNSLVFIYLFFFLLILFLSNSSLIRFDWEKISNERMSKYKKRKKNYTNGKGIVLILCVWWLSKKRHIKPESYNYGM